MTTPRKTSTPTLVSALRILAGEIESPDGVANMAIGEGADRIEELAAELARVTAQREEAISNRDEAANHAKALEFESDRLERRRQYETDLVCAAILEANARGVSFGSAELCARVDEIRALRARVAELEAEIERWRTATAKLRDGADEAARVANEQLARAERRVAELEAALRDAQEVLNEYAEDGTHRAARLASERIGTVLARAEPADLVQEACGGRCGDPYCNLSTEGELMREPANHPDSDRLDWIARAAIDAARQEAAS